MVLAQALTEPVPQAYFPLFLSVVCVVRNQAESLEEILRDFTRHLESLVADYELIVVENASSDDSVKTLMRLTVEHGLPNLQVYALAHETDVDTAAWAGMENALGDFVAVVDPKCDQISFLQHMLDKAALGNSDVVFAQNLRKPRQRFAYRVASAVFNRFYKALNGVHLPTEAPQFRLLSKRAMSFVLRHAQPSLAYRQLPGITGFSRTNLEYSAEPRVTQAKKVSEGLDLGMRLLVSTTHAPMRLVTALSLFGAASNLIYSCYVLTTAIFKDDVAPGWVSLSLQQSGMFFLISMVLLVLGEYILHMARLSNEGPAYHIAQEFSSAHIRHRERLNVEEPDSRGGGVRPPNVTSG